MKIERVVIRNLRALRDRDDPFSGANGVFSSICLRGLNGSGKTTYLEGLAQLWQWFRRCTTQRGFARIRARPLGATDDEAMLGEADLFGALFTDLPGPRSRLWIAVGSPAQLKAQLDGDPDSAYLFKGDRVLWDPEVLAWWDTAFARAQSGGEPTPNVVWIQAENKYVPPVRKGDLIRPSTGPSFVIVARHLPKEHGQNHLEALMRNLFLVRPDRWQILATAISDLRPGLQLLKVFSEDEQRPLFALPGGEIITQDRLSAGERSVLINLTMILRWMGPRGIVLIDEPELHQHVSLMRGSVAVTESLVDASFQGQLLVASHAPEVWDHYRTSQLLVDLD